MGQFYQWHGSKKSHGVRLAVMEEPIARRLAKR